MAKKESGWVRFGNAFKGATGVTLFGALIIFGSSGKTFLEAAGAFPALVSAFSSGLPLGFWSGVIGGLVGTGFHLFARSWHKRSFGIELATIVTGLAVVMVQQNGGSASELLRALCVGLVAGFGGLFTAKGLRAMFSKEEEDADTGSGESRSEPVPPTD